MNGASTGLHDRLKKTAAISRLGQGMDLGGLNDYAHEIALYLLLKVFYREINNSDQRTRNDLLAMTEDIIAEMKLEADPDQIERLVNGILYAGDPRQQSSFSVMLYDETDRGHKEYNFRYLIPDREASRWDEGGSTVYMLTETAQEIIFITREVLQEFGFDLEQFYTLQLIKNGNFTEAKGSVSNLIARVRNLIKKEKDWREDIQRNPSLIFSAQNEKNQRSEEEVREQFAEEKRVFADMFSWRERLDKFPTGKKKEGELLFEELERARALHDRLAELTISNLSLELEMRKKNPDIFWKTATVSFKKDFWQETVMNSGLPRMELLTDLLNPLFSPDQPFIFPLDWAWSEQQLYTYLEDAAGEEVEPEEEEQPPVEEINWDLILDLWQPVFDHLLEKSRYPLAKLEGLSPEVQRRWLVQEKNLELFMMFIITDIRLTLVKEEFPGLDERLLLFKKLVEEDDKYGQLEGEKITAGLDSGRGKIELAGKFTISPYILYLEEE